MVNWTWRSQKCQCMFCLVFILFTNLPPGFCLPLKIRKIWPHICVPYSHQQYNQLELKTSFLGRTCLLWFTPVTATPYCPIPNCFLHLPYHPNPHRAFEFENHNLICLWYFIHKIWGPGTQPITGWTEFQTHVSWLLLQASFHLTADVLIWRLASVNYFEPNLPCFTKYGASCFIMRKNWENSTSASTPRKVNSSRLLWEVLEERFFGGFWWRPICRTIKF